MEYIKNNKQKQSIEAATKRVKERMPIEKVRLIPKYKDITEDGYEELIQFAERMALIILNIMSKKK